jgi:hypothetical protein
MLLTILYALLSLAGAILIIYLILWILGLLGIVIPENIRKVIWAILIILALIFIVTHFFSGADLGIHHYR